MVICSITESGVLFLLILIYLRRNYYDAHHSSHNYNHQDNLPRQGTATSSTRDSDGNSYNVSLAAQKGFWNKLRLSASMTAGRSSNDGLSTKIDTTTSTVTNTVLNVDTGNGSRNFSVSPSVRYEISERSSLGLSYSYSDSYSSVVQWSYDVTDPPFCRGYRQYLYKDE